MHIYSDADWAGDILTWRYTTGHVCKWLSPVVAVETANQGINIQHAE